MEFLQQIVELANAVLETIQNTVEMLDSITFDEGFVRDYLGYAKYVLGTPLYTLLTTVILIGLGVTLWTYLLKGITYLKSLLPY